MQVAATAVLQHGPKPCTIAFDNQMQALLSRAEHEVSTEVQDLQDAKGRLQGELDKTRQLWNQGQTTHRVSERSAGLRDDVEAVQCDIEAAAATHEQLKTRVGKAAAQKDSFLETGQLWLRGGRSRFPIDRGACRRRLRRPQDHVHGPGCS